MYVSTQAKKAAKVTPTGRKIEVEGIINRVFYPKSLEDHMVGMYAIVRFEVTKVIKAPPECSIYKGSCISVKGAMPRLEYPSAPDKEHKNYVTYTLLADEVEDDNWGTGYVVTSMQMKVSLDTIEDQRHFLSVILTPTQIDNLYKIYPNPMGLFENEDVAGLVRVPGVGEKTAKKLIDRYRSVINNANAYLQLSKYGLTNNAIAKLCAIYKSTDIAIARIQENPYMLIREVRGYGWKKADLIALNQGIGRSDPKRVKAYTEYYLMEQCEANGHSWIDINTLLTAVQTECSPIADDVLVSIVKEMLTEEVETHYYAVSEDDGSEAKGTKIITYRGPLLFFESETNRCGLYKYRETEKTIAQNLYRIQTANCGWGIDKNKCESLIKEIEEEQGFEYTDEQKAAVWNILNNQVSILTGKGGTGKSSTVNAIVKIAKAFSGEEPKMCALSGRASSKLTEITGLHGQTIHKLLGYNPALGGFMYDEKSQLSGSMFVLDEASMVGAELFEDLVKAIPSGAKFLMVGDIAQLESIGMGNVLKDCMASGVISSNVLTKIHRQAQKSGIITESLRISQGNAPFGKDAIVDGEYRGELQDLKYVLFDDYNLAQSRVVNEYIELFKAKKVNPKDIQVIVPMRSRGNLSCRCINEQIQKIVNNKNYPSEKTVAYTDAGLTWNVTYKPNDRVIVMKNDYNAETENGKQTAIFNGNIGYIRTIEDDHMVIDLLTQKGVVLKDKQYANIGLAYCVTCHKCQGDSAPYVIFGLDVSAWSLLSREMVYTAITRARKFCSVVVQNTAFMTAIKTSRIRLKQTWLTMMLQKAFIQNDPEFQMPINGEPPKPVYAVQVGGEENDDDSVPW